MSAPRPPTQEEVQADLMRLEAYRNQLGALLQQHEYLSASQTDHRRARETLEGLERIEAGSEFLIPVGGETFLRGSTVRDAKVLLGIGSGVVVEYERPKASEVLADRIGKIQSARQELEGQMSELEERIESLSERLEAMSRGRSAPPDDVGRD